MAAAVYPSAKVASGPFHMASHQRINANTTISPPVASSSRYPQHIPSPDVSTSSSVSPDTTSKAFQRIRSSLEQSLRTATRSKKVAPPPADEFSTVTARNSKGKEKAAVVQDVPKEKEKSKMLRRLESKVTFRRTPRESLTPSPIPPPAASNTKAGDVHDRVRAAGFTSYNTPSMRQASMSSPSLHLSSQALPSPKSRSAIPVSSSSGADALVSPTRERSRRTSLQPQPQQREGRPREIGSPTPLASSKDVRSTSGQVTSEVSRGPSSRHRATKSTPPVIPTSPSTPSLPTQVRDSTRGTSTPTRAQKDLPSPPDTPTPSTSQVPLTRSPSRSASAANGRSNSPVTPRAASPIRARSPSTRIRVVTPTQRGLSSTSASHLPLSSSPSPTPRRPSIEVRRPSGEPTRRPSIDVARRPSRNSPDGGRAESPSPVRPRPVSPAQRSYAQNRHYNISAASLSLPPLNPEHRELIRTATSMLCKEIVKPPPHMSRTDGGIRDWEEVELRTRNLVRLERIWGKSGGAGAGSSSNISIAGMSSTGLSASGEERERRLFCEALRDGFVLCQLMNKLRSSSVVKPDSREDGFVKTSNVTKFLAACASYGLPNEDLFLRDDLMEGTSESLARVAGTIIALIKFVDTPAPSRLKYISGQSRAPNSPTVLNPYGGTISRASASTPNLHPTSTSPTPPSSPARKRWSPPSGLPTVRSDSPGECSSGSSKARSRSPDVHDRRGDGDEVEVKAILVPQIMTPPPRSPLRPRSKRSDDGGLSAWARTAASPPRSSVADSVRASIDDASVRDSVADSNHHIRQSVASSAVTDNTVITAVSSILDNEHSGSSYNKFGTFRTVTTDLTSEAPSMTRAEGTIIAEDLARKRSGEAGGKHSRERKMSGAPVVDLSRVAEETDESISSKGNARDKGRARTAAQESAADKPEKTHAVHLRKGKWPDDFLDAFQSQPRPIASKSPSPDQEDSSYSSTPITTPISISPPRKLAIIGATRQNESLEALPQFPRRPSHRARHSVDAPVLLPKESVLRRDASPDGIQPSSPGRMMLRRHSTKPNVTQRSGVYLSRQSQDESRDSDSDSRAVPFPRTASGEHGPGTPSPRSSGADVAGLSDRPRLARGRFQSDIEDSSSRRRARPSSYDELGVKPVRTRFESMANLGVGSSTASASDLMSRESMDGSAVRMTLVVRDEGKPPTHFQLGNCIGRGQFGSVYRALNLNTGQMVAVKRIRLEGLKEEEVTTLMREVDLVKSMSHPSIVKYEGMARDDNTLSIVLEYVENGSLGQTLKAFGKLNERLVASYVIKILEGLHYLHQSDVVHCDLKAANILTTKNGNVKLSDFGVSLNLRAVGRETKDVAGTPNWMAPEVIELKGASTKSDIWSLACTIIELLTGRPPYAEITNSMSVMFRIVEDNMPPLPEGCSPLLEDFLMLCFNKDPSKRPSAELLFEHPWLKKNWGALKDLRPQDSIPFLRRVSAEVQKTEAVRYLSQIEMPDTPSEGLRETNPSPVGRRTSNASIRPLGDNDISPREHSFVKTTFSKPMVCRVCQLSVKKSAVLCAQCSLISHAKCADSAPPTCDLRAQLLLYAQYAEKGNPGSIYSNPAEFLNDVQPKVAMSDVPYVAHSPRTSIDAPPPPQSPTQQHTQPVHPPTAFKFMAAFKRSRSRANLTPEPSPVSVPSSSSLPSANDVEDRPPRRRPTVLQKERPLSVTSDSTGISSLRSAATAAESLSSRQDTRRSQFSLGETDKPTRIPGSTLPTPTESIPNRPSKVTFSTGLSEAPLERDVHVPGAMPVETRGGKKKDAKSANNNCVVQ
ncbi:hypothetical protein BDQ12DRAFT_511749 [Crucibulum laeve]|uniref:Protein kinase domain-containing protein n=1 Tax=Crucibulum laeve TaxID=68775 RepID=A0A5C3MF45_9AGAR|nr:hypothetical protein BDQ12DRAFT_511749 [Crucibulum laeve]